MPADIAKQFAQVTFSASVCPHVLFTRQSIGSGPSPAQPPDGETSEGAQVLLHITTHDWEPRPC